MNGAILWQGSSLLDGSPVVVVATGLSASSSNRKTGAMVQSWILRADMDPLSVLAIGADRSICGDCPRRWDEITLETQAEAEAKAIAWVNGDKSPALAVPTS